MKTLFVSITLIASSLFLSAQTPTETTSEGNTITISVPVQSSEGNIVVGLYNQTNFMKNPSEGATGEIIDGKATVTFSNVVPGEYAVILYHDKNLNKTMDFDLNGMPLEMYGMSNNPMSYGPPQWSDAKFEVIDTSIEMEIRM